MNKQEKTPSNLGVLWCPDSELNQGHGDFQSPALPTELSGHIVLSKWWAILGSNQGPTGYEPVALTTELMAHICYKEDGRGGRI